MNQLKELNTQNNQMNQKIKPSRKLQLSQNSLKKKKLIAMQNERSQKLNQPLQLTSTKYDSAQKRTDMKNTQTRRQPSQGRRSSEIEEQSFGKQPLKEIQNKQDVLAQYITLQNNDAKWEQMIDNVCVYFTKFQDKIKQRVTEKDYLTLADQATNYWIERYQQLEQLFCEALNKIDVQSSLLYDMQFQYQFLIRQSHDLLMILGNLLSQSQYISNETSNQVEQLNLFCQVNLITTLDELYNCSNKSLQTLSEEIKTQIDIKQIETNISKQTVLKNEFEIVSLNKEIESLNQRLNLISFNYEEVLKEILKIMDPNYFVERNSSINQQPIQVQNRHKQVIQFIKSYQEIAQRNKDLENEISSIKRNSDLQEKQIRQEEQQNSTLNKQIKQLQLLYQESEQKSELLQMQLKQKEEDEINLRQKYLETSKKFNEIDSLHKTQQENFNLLVEQFNVIKEENTQTIQSYEDTLEQMQTELDKYSIQNQAYKNNESELNQKLKNLTLLVESQKRVIDQKESLMKELFKFTQNFGISLQKYSDQKPLDVEYLLKDIKLSSEIKTEYRKIIIHLNSILQQFCELKKVECRTEKQFLELMFRSTKRLGQLNRNEKNSLESRLQQFASLIQNNKVSQLLIIQVIQQTQNFKMIGLICAEMFLELSTFLECILSPQKELNKIQESFTQVEQTTEHFLVSLQEIQGNDKWINQIEASIR